MGQGTARLPHPGVLSLPSPSAGSGAEGVKTHIVKCATGQKIQCKDF